MRKGSDSVFVTRCSLRAEWLPLPSSLANGKACLLARRSSRSRALRSRPLATGSLADARSGAGRAFLFAGSLDGRGLERHGRGLDFGGELEK